MQQVRRVLSRSVAGNVYIADKGNNRVLKYRRGKAPNDQSGHIEVTRPDSRPRNRL
jgi:hypothetical protein